MRERGYDTTDPEIGTVFEKAFAMYVEIERAMTIERIKTGMDRTRRRKTRRSTEDDDAGSSGIWKRFENAARLLGTCF
jgi:hypothetical protein